MLMQKVFEIIEQQVWYYLLIILYNMWLNWLFLVPYHTDMKFIFAYIIILSFFRFSF